MKDSDVFECLETGAQELGTLLGYGPNTEELTCDQIVQRWLSNTVGAGLTSEDAHYLWLIDWLRSFRSCKTFIPFPLPKA